MRIYVCTVCGYLFEEEKGNPEVGVAPGTPWEEIPDSWVCPVCGAPKAAFELKEDAPEKEPGPAVTVSADDQTANPSALALSMRLSNLARGSEKQYRPEEAERFMELADFFRAAAGQKPDAEIEELTALLQEDLDRYFPAAFGAARAAGDRGALRALVWSEKVTKMMRSLWSRFPDGRIPEDTGVYVCTVCGFIFVGNAPPDVCPVCKVPGWKFRKIEGRDL